MAISASVISRCGLMPHGRSRWAGPKWNQWPRIRSVNKREIVPLFRRWSKDLKKQIRPAKFKRLHRRKRRLLGLLALGWFQPKAFYIRMLNFLMRTVIWTVRIVEAGRGAVVGLWSHSTGHLGGQSFSNRTIEYAMAGFHKGRRRNIFPNRTQVCSFTSLKLWKVTWSCCLSGFRVMPQRGAV